MTTEMVRQALFTTGEVDAVNFKRTDYPDYMAAAQSLLNAEIATTGLARKRKGTKYLYNWNAYSDDNAQGFEFKDNDGNYYLLIGGNLRFEVFTIVGDVLTHYQTVSTPYLSAQIPEIDYATDNDSIVLAHSSYPTARIYVSSYGPVVFAYQALAIYPQPAYDFNTINYNNFTVVAIQTGEILTLSLVSLLGDPGFTTAWIGGQIVGGGASDIDPIGYAIITDVSPYAAGVVTFTARVQIDFKSPGVASGAQYSIKQPVFTAAFGYPANVVYYQNRLWLAATRKLNNTIFGSKIGQPISFDVGIGRDTDAIIYTIGDSDSGKILWMNGGKQLEIYAQNYEYAAPQQENIGLTPSTFSIRKQTAFGTSANIKPITYINDSYYVSKTGKAVVNYRFDGIGQTYTSTNISVASSHLVKSPINRALQRGSDVSQDNFIYYLNSDDTVTAFQFAAEYKLAALTPIKFQSDDSGNSTVRIMDVISVNNEIYFLKHLLLSGNYTIEKFVPSYFVDSFQTTNMPSNGIITGLSLYNGYKLQVVLGNQDYGEYLVSGGQITVDNMGDSGTVQVGFLYPFEVVPMYLFAGPQRADYLKNITRIYVDYNESLNFTIDGVLVDFQVFENIQNSIPLAPQSGTWIVDSMGGWERFSTFTIAQNAPFDCQIVAISYQIDSTII